MWNCGELISRMLRVASEVCFCRPACSAGGVSSRWSVASVVLINRRNTGSEKEPSAITDGSRNEILGNCVICGRGFHAHLLFCSPAQSPRRKLLKIDACMRECHIIKQHFGFFFSLYFKSFRLFIFCGYIRNMGWIKHATLLQQEKPKTNVTTLLSNRSIKVRR